MSAAREVGGRLPPWGRVLVVVAHPDDESFGLGALLDRFVREGAEVSVLCLTRGEASTLGEVEGDLAAVRADELHSAAVALGVQHTTLCGHPDGGLSGLDPAGLQDEVAEEVRRVAPDGMLVFDPVAGVTGHADHEVASLAAVAVGERLGAPVLGWALPDDVASGAAGGDRWRLRRAPGREALTAVAVDRTRQLDAVRCHATQAVPGSVLWRRLELLGDVEYVRDLV